MSIISIYLSMKSSGYTNKIKRKEERERLLKKKRKSCKKTRKLIYLNKRGTLVLIKKVKLC